MSRYSTLMSQVRKQYKNKTYLCRLKSKLGTHYHPCDSVNLTLLNMYIKCKACPFNTRIELSKFKEKLCHASKL